MLPARITSLRSSTYTMLPACMTHVLDEPYTLLLPLLPA